MPLYKYFIKVSWVSSDRALITPGMSADLVVLRIVNSVWRVMIFADRCAFQEHGKRNMRHELTLASSTLGPYGALSRITVRAPGISFLSEVRGVLVSRLDRSTDPQMKHTQTAQLLHSHSQLRRGSKANED